MFLAFEAKNLGWWRNVESLPVGIVGRAKFCAVRLRAADAGHDQVFLMSKSVLGEVGFHVAVLVALMVPRSRRENANSHSGLRGSEALNALSISGTIAARWCLTLR